MESAADLHTIDSTIFGDEHKFLQSDDFGEVYRNPFFHYHTRPAFHPANFGHAWIPCLEFTRNEVTKRLQCLAQSKSSDKKMNERALLERKLALITQRIHSLREGHSRLSKKLRLDAAALRALPPELREPIYSHLLHVEDQPVKLYNVGIPDDDFNGPVPLMPDDETFYLSAYHVGSDISAEAAEVYYKENTFHFCNAELLHGFLYHDHYGSGVVPRNFVRHLAFCGDTFHEGRIPNKFLSAFDFETEYKEPLVPPTKTPPGFRQICSGWRSGHRGPRQTLEPLFDAPKLRSVSLEVVYCHHCRVDLRDFSPVVYRLQERGVAVTVWGHFGCCHWCGAAKTINISHLWDQPSAKDVLTAIRVDAEEDVAKASLASHGPEWFRVKLWEHWQLWKEERAEIGALVSPACN